MSYYLLSPISLKAYKYELDFDYVEANGVEATFTRGGVAIRQQRVSILRF